MLHSKFFLIEPLSAKTPELARFLTEDELLLCSSPSVIGHEFADKSDWTHADICLAVKLAYLAQVLDIFQDENKRAQIFGSANVSEDVFDRWWSIKPIEYLGRTKEFQQELRSFADSLRVSNSPVVTNWLKNVLSK